jgi:hypothetical protein
LWWLVQALARNRGPHKRQGFRIHKPPSPKLIPSAGKKAGNQPRIALKESPYREPPKLTNEAPPKGRSVRQVLRHILPVKVKLIAQIDSHYAMSRWSAYRRPQVSTSRIGQLKEIVSARDTIPKIDILFVGVSREGLVEPFEVEDFATEAHAKTSHAFEFDDSGGVTHVLAPEARHHSRVVISIASSQPKDSVPGPRYMPLKSGGFHGCRSNPTERGPSSPELSEHLLEAVRGQPDVVVHEEHGVPFRAVHTDVPLNGGTASCTFDVIEPNVCPPAKEFYV